MKKLYAILTASFLTVSAFSAQAVELRQEGLIAILSISRPTKIMI